MINVLVIGASGFVGKHLVERLKENKNLSVKVLIYSTNHDFGDDVKVYKGSVLNLESLFNAIEPNDIVINLSYISDSDSSTNIHAINNIVDVCARVGVARLVHCSSVDVYGRSADEVITELSACSPVTSYAVTKNRIDDVVINAAELGLSFVIIRLASVFGTGGENLNRHIDFLNKKSRFFLYLKSCLFYQRQMNLLAVENAVEAISFLSLFDARVSGEIFIVSDDDEANNNYSYIERVFMQYFGISYYKMFLIPIPSIILKVILICLKKDNVNPSRRYLSAKLISYGFVKKVSFDDAVSSFLNTWKSNLKN